MLLCCMEFGPSLLYLVGRMCNSLFLPQEISILQNYANVDSVAE